MSTEITEPTRVDLEQLDEHVYRMTLADDYGTESSFIVDLNYIRSTQHDPSAFVSALLRGSTGPASWLATSPTTQLRAVAIGSIMPQRGIIVTLRGRSSPVYLVNDDLLDAFDMLVRAWIGEEYRPIEEETGIEE